MTEKVTLFIDAEGRTSLANTMAVYTMEEGWIAVFSFPSRDVEHRAAVLAALVQPLTKAELMAWREEVRRSR